MHQFTATFETVLTATSNYLCIVLNLHSSKVRGHSDLFLYCVHLNNTYTMRDLFALITSHTFADLNAHSCEHKALIIWRVITVFFVPSELHSIKVSPLKYFRARVYKFTIILET